MVFGLSSSNPKAGHQRSSAIGKEFTTKTKIWKPRDQEKNKKKPIKDSWVPRFPDF
jgi:hypothetical protein